MTIAMAEQLGLVTMKPRLKSRFVRWASIKARCSGFTSGISSGTSWPIRCDEELLITGYPARAKSYSALFAMSPGKLEKTKSHSSGGDGGCTMTSLIALGISPGKRQVHASAYVFPCDRSEAARAATSNCG